MIINPKEIPVSNMHSYLLSADSSNQINRFGFLSLNYGFV